MTITSSTSEHKLDHVIQEYVPKILVITIFLFFLYLITNISNKISFIFLNNQSLQNLYPFSFEFYFLSVLTILFLILWIFTISRSILLFFDSFFPYSKGLQFQKHLLKINVIIFSFIFYILFDLFNPHQYFLFGLITCLKEIELVFELKYSFFTPIITFADYTSFTSILLLLSTCIIALSIIYFFTFHCIYYFHKNSGLNDNLSRNYSNAIVKALLFVWSPFLLIYLSIIYNQANDVISKLIILITFLTLILWMIYKLTSSYYRGFNIQWISLDISVFSILFILIILFVFPVIFWYINDFYYLYIYQTTQNTIISDFGSVLFANGLVSKSVIDKPWTMDPYSLLFLTTIAIHRILLVDVLLVLIIGFFMLTFTQFQFIYTYFKSKLNSDFNTKLREENPDISKFNAKIQNHRVLHYLFVLFVVFLAWDVSVVTILSIIKIIEPHTGLKISNYIIITSLITFYSHFQSSVSNSLIFLLLALFLGTLIVFNIVSIKLKESTLKKSYSGSLYLVLTSFMLIIAYLIYDLQNYDLNPLEFFKTIQISSYINLDTNFFLIIAYYCDYLLLLIFLGFIFYKVEIKFLVKETKDSTNTENTEKIMSMEDTEKTEESEQTKTENIDQNPDNETNKVQ